MTPQSVKLLVIILNYRTPEVTIDCLRTLAAEQVRDPLFRVVLIDNASGDDSVPRIEAVIREEGWGEWLDFQPHESNSGFAGGNNLALKEALAGPAPPPFYLLLNSDTLVDPGCLAHCVALMEREPAIGALSCMLLNRDRTVQNVCRKFPRPDRETVRAFGLPWMLPRLFRWADLEDAGWDRWEKARDVEWIGGAFFMTRLETLRKAGLLDEGFFFYGEDCEWCHRIRKAGYRVHFDPAVTTVHLGGASSDGTRMRNRTKDLHTWRARFRVQRQCYGPLAKWWVRACYTTQFAMRLLLMRVRGRTATREYEDTVEGLRQLTGRVKE